VSSGDTVAVTVSGTFDRTDVGDGTVTLGTPTVTGKNAENYEIIMPKTVNGTINRRHVLVTVNPGQGKVYGQADPVLTYTVTAANGLTGGGLIGGDTIPYAPVRAAGEAAGSYEITRGRIPDFYYNYAIDGFTGGTFTISKAVVTASADSKTMTVGGTLPAFTVSYAGIVSGDTADGIFATKSTAACTADGKTAGTYDISVTTPVLKTEATKNYTVGSSVGGTLTVSNPAPVAPGGSTDTGTKVTVPVSSGEGNVKVEATVKDGTAAVTLTDAQITEIASGKSDTGTVKLDVSSLDVKAATIPAKVIAAADKSGNTDGIQVALPTGTVTLDKTALAAVSDKGGDVTVSVDKVDNAKLTETQKAVLGSQAGTALVVDVTVLASGEKVSAFNGGSIGVAVPYTPKASEDTGKLVVWFINDDGSIEPKTGSYNAKTGKFEFQTQHFPVCAGQLPVQGRFREQLVLRQRGLRLHERPVLRHRQHRLQPQPNHDPGHAGHRSLAHGGQARSQRHREFHRRSRQRLLRRGGALGGCQQDRRRLRPRQLCPQRHRHPPADGGDSVPLRVRQGLRCQQRCGSRRVRGQHRGFRLREIRLCLGGKRRPGQGQR
jgi:hypothetical protein